MANNLFLCFSLSTLDLHIYTTPIHNFDIDKENHSVYNPLRILHDRKVHDMFFLFLLISVHQCLYLKTLKSSCFSSAGSHKKCTRILQNKHQFDYNYIHNTRMLVPNTSRSHRMRNYFCNFVRPLLSISIFIIRYAAS